jgi:hypothetical protein
MQDSGYRMLFAESRILYPVSHRQEEPNERNSHAQSL